MSEEQAKPASQAKLTKTSIDRLPLTTDGKQYAVMDTELRGFGIRVGATSKTFIVYKRLPHGDPKRVTLGKYGSLTVDEARKSAQEQLSAIVHGIDINAKRKAIKLQKNKDEIATSQTLGWLFDLYKREHLIVNKGSKQGTLRSFEDTLNFFKGRRLTLLKQDKKSQWQEDKDIILEDWLTRPFREITPQQVLERHDFFSRGKPTRLIGGVLAPMQRTHQIAFKFAQAAFNFHLPRLELQGDGSILANPFDVLKVYSRWKPVNVRSRFIDFTNPEEIGAWIEAIYKYRETNPVASDFMLFSLLQAGRSIEIWGLTWDDIDFQHSNVVYKNTKNGQTYEFPMSRLALEILKRRQATNEPKNSPWVWAYSSSKTGHIPEDAKHHFHELVKLGAKYVSSHDLKRTWASAAHTLSFSERDINYLLKHAERDVNKHYFVRFRSVALQILQGVEDLFMTQHASYIKHKE